jgi:hypothetical protein
MRARLASLQSMASVYKVAWVASHRQFCEHKRAQRARHAARHAKLLELAAEGRARRAAAPPVQPTSGPWQAHADAISGLDATAAMAGAAHDSAYVQPDTAVRTAEPEHSAVPQHGSSQQHLVAQTLQPQHAAIALSSESRARQAQAVAQSQPAPSASVHVRRMRSSDGPDAPVGKSGEVDQVAGAVDVHATQA